MKAFFGRVVLILLAMVVFSALPAQTKQKNTERKSPAETQQAENVPSSNFEQQLIVVEDLAAEVHSDSGTITVTATIRNVSRAMISGYATIHLLSDEGKPLLSYEEEINGGESFSHGTAVDFEITARVGNIDKVSSITVDFTKT